jgi:hypothetical protein
MVDPLVDPLVLLACVPVEAHPTLPEEATYSTYKIVKCPGCGVPMWLGNKSEKLVAQGRTAICMYCVGVLMRKHGITDTKDITVILLTDPKAGKK